jgi:predicted  nucleic acid-binding Zn-ribbon protein
MSDEQKAAAAAAKAAAPPKPRVVKAPSATAGASARDLRAALKEVENEAAAVREAIASATAKFQPKIDALRSKHAELSAQLAATLFK